MKAKPKNKTFKYFVDYRQKLFNRIWFAETEQAKIYLINEIEKANTEIRKFQKGIPEIKHNFKESLIKLYVSYREKYAN